MVLKFQRTKRKRKEKKRKEKKRKKRKRKKKKQSHTANPILTLLTSPPEQPLMTSFPIITFAHELSPSSLMRKSTRS